ncbi:hypothetical protein E2C01_018075 [Portunus trituberculatus]|uniref:Uncharacterized protein n=1 Tax=Portunus trituberculatus TaxID=210409 RepID=A0A5B7DU45_PORTR|nr:hypothetical protein [Portunus trituberculatus]
MFPTNCHVVNKIIFYKVFTSGKSGSCCGGNGGETSLPVTIDGRAFQVVRSAKLLSLTIDKLTHIHLLGRLKKLGTPSRELASVYSIFILPRLTSASPAWSSSLTATKQNQLERVQKKGGMTGPGDRLHHLPGGPPHPFRPATNIASSSPPCSSTTHATDTSFPRQLLLSTTISDTTRSWFLSVREQTHAKIVQFPQAKMLNL